MARAIMLIEARDPNFRFHWDMLRELVGVYAPGQKDLYKKYLLDADVSIHVTPGDVRIYR